MPKSKKEIEKGLKEKVFAKLLMMYEEKERKLKKINKKSIELESRKYEKWINNISEVDILG